MGLDCYFFALTEDQERTVLRGWQRRTGPFRIEHRKGINPFTGDPMVFRRFVDETEPEPSPDAVTPVLDYVEHQIVWKWMEMGRLTYLVRSALDLAEEEADMMVRRLELVGPPEFGGWVCEVPQALAQRLARADQSFVEEVARKYVACERGSSDGLAEVIWNVCGLSKRAVEGGMRVYLWTPSMD
jgi:hypothetical protein